MAKADIYAPNVNVVVCAYNRAHLLRRAVASLLALECFDAFTFEVVVVDNGSTENTSGVVVGPYLRNTVPAHPTTSPGWSTRRGCPQSLRRGGLVVGEAMRHGRPVIGANSGALPELVRPGIDGEPVTTGDAESLANYMSALWNEPNLCVRLGEAAEIAARQHYTEVKYYTRIMVVYRQAMGGGKQR